MARAGPRWAIQSTRSDLEDVRVSRTWMFSVICSGHEGSCLDDADDFFMDLFPRQDGISRKDPRKPGAMCEQVPHRCPIVAVTVGELWCSLSKKHR